MRGKNATILQRNTNEQYENDFAQIRRIKKCNNTRQQTFQWFLSCDLLHKDSVLRKRRSPDVENVNSIFAISLRTRYKS